MAENYVGKGFAGSLVFLLSLVLVAACGPSIPNNVPPGPSGFVTTGGPVPPTPISGGGRGDLTVCSSLNFSGVTWDSSLSTSDQTAIEIALNISGSYEGAAGWANLTNDFDGQGVSMGLLNQNLGTGSLQPLLIQMNQEYPAVLQSLFDSTRLNSLLGMLSQWSGVSSDVAALSLQSAEPKSLLDIPFVSPGMIAQDTSSDSTSVAWAVKTLYTDSGKTFDPTWSADLQSLGQNPDYISLQIEAALDLHKSALQEESQGGVDELRAYLLMFDINVQDGGMYSQDWTDYQTWVASNSSATDTQRLDELLQLRLRHVLAQYVSDVQSRKQTIINGTGVVHGANRNLETQYCFNRMATYP